MAFALLLVSHLACVAGAGVLWWRARRRRGDEAHPDEVNSPALGEQIRGFFLNAAPLGFVVLAIFLWSLSFATLVPLELGQRWWVSLSAGALVAAPFAVLSPHWRRRAAGLFIVAVAFLSVADIVYWRFFDSLMPLSATQSAGLALDVSASIIALLQAADATLVFFVILGVLVFLTAPSTAAPRTWKTRIALIGIMTILAIPSVNDVTAWMGTRFSWKIFGWDQSVKRVGVAQAHVRDFARTFRETLQTAPIDDATVAAFVDANVQHRGVLADDERLQRGDAKGSNVVVVQIEAMQRWVVGAAVDGKAVTPFLNLARQHGTFYSNVWDVTGGSPTSDCEFAALNSQYPLAQGSVAFRRQGNAFTTIPSLLNDVGVTTASGHANAPRMWNRGVIHPAWGFSTSWFRDAYPTTPKYGWGLADHTFFQASLDKMAALPRPFMTFLITLTSHHPFRFVPPRHKAWRKFLTRPFGDYTANMHYVDQALVHLFAGLKEKNLLSTTTVVLYGDHDAKLKAGIKGTRSLVDKVGLSKLDANAIAKRQWRTKKIPLFILTPQQGEALLAAWEKRKPSDPQPQDFPHDVTAVGSQVDIGPTLLRALGLPIPNSFVGRPLVGSQSGFAAKADGSCVDATYLYDAKLDSCSFRITGKKTPLQECAALRAKCNEGLSRSWTMTLNDLAPRMNALKRPAFKTSVAPKQAIPSDGGPKANGQPASAPDGGAVSGSVGE